MNPIRLPIFVRLKDCGEVVRYDSVVKMQAQFERIDVENEEYDVWDAAGVRLGLSVQASADWLRVESTAKCEPQQLAKAIAEFARLQSLKVDTSKLEAGDFQGAWEQATSAVQAKRPPHNWWRRFTQRP